jgi:hypothetical protein
LFVAATGALAIFAPRSSTLRCALDLMHRKSLTIDAWEGARFYNEIRRDNRKVLWQCAAVKLPNAEKAIVEREKVAVFA